MKHKTMNLNAKHPKDAYIDEEPAQKPGLPTGPLKDGGEGREGSLLVFVPRNPVGTLIDKMTGGYGYSHMAIDCGEVDIPSGKRVMIQATPALGVHRAFQDQYGERKFVRIPLKNTGMDIDEFCDCIRSKLGEKYSDEEILTLGLIENPAKQICSDLATVCLPKNMLVSMARYYQKGFLHRLSAVRIYGKLNKKFHLFVSPNAFSQYFGAPHGSQLDGIDQLSEPTLPLPQMGAKRPIPTLQIVGMAVLGGLILIGILRKKERSGRKKKLF